MPNPNFTRIDLAAELRPRVPKGDCATAASDVLSTVVMRTLQLSNELKIVANAHFDAAPASSEHVLELDAAIARAVLDWVAQWPQ
jgi:hypothetical protein